MRAGLFLTYPYVVAAVFILLGSIAFGQDEVIIDATATWKYWDGQPLPAEDAERWYESDHDDRGWQQDMGPFGYGNDDDEETPLNFGTNAAEKLMSYYFRHTFTLDDPAVSSVYRIDFQVDDGALIYVNGHLVSRHNMRTDEDIVRVTVSGDNKYIVRHNYIAARHFINGTNVLAVQVQQVDPSSSDLRFDLTMSAIGKGKIGAPVPAYPREPHPRPGGGVSAIVRREAWTAFGLSGHGFGQGNVDIFHREDDGRWSFFQRLELEDAARDDHFGASLAYHEESDSLLVGVPGRPHSVAGKLFQGVVAVFRRDNQGRFQFDSLVAPEAGLDSVGRFGRSLSLYQDEMLIGAPADVGHAIFYRYSQGQWHYQSHFTQSGNIAADFQGSFGNNVALEGDRAVVSNPNESLGDQILAGAIYIYERTAGEWRETRRFQPSLLGQGWNLGVPLVLQGNTIIAGAAGYFQRTEGPGAVFVFRRTLFGWRHAQTLEGDARFPFRFGGTIGFYGNQFVVAETASLGLPDAYGTSRLHLYIRENEESDWAPAEVFVEDLFDTFPGEGPRLFLDAQGIFAANMLPVNDYHGHAYAIAQEGTPVFHSDPDKTTSSGLPYRHEVRVTPAVEGLQIEALELPDWLSFSMLGPGRALLEGTPGPADTGQALVVLRASLGNAATEQRFQLRVNAEVPVPQIVIEPQDVTTLSGRTATFTVGLREDLPVEVAWWHDGQKIEGEDGFTLTLPSLSDSDNGHYWATVTNAAEISVESRHARLQVITANPGTAILVPDDAFTLAEALEKARPGSEVYVRPGSYVGASLTIGNRVSLRSLGGPEVTALTGARIAMEEGTRIEGFYLDGYSTSEWSATITAKPGASIIGNVFPTAIGYVITIGDQFADLSGARTYIERNRFQGDSDSPQGIALNFNSNDVLVANNVFAHVGRAIRVHEDVEQIHILHNTFTGSRLTIEIDSDGEGVQIANNVFGSVNNAIMRRSLSRSPALSNFHHNVFFEVRYPLDGNRAFLEGNGNVMGNPQFHDPSGGLFQLTAESAAIDAAAAVDPPVDLDFAGNSRSRGEAPDAGAYEFTPADPLPAPELRADSAAVDLVRLGRERLWTHIRLEGQGESWSLESIPEWLEVSAMRGTLPATLSMRVRDNHSGDTGILVLHSGAETDRLFLWSESFFIDSATFAFPDPDIEKARRILVTYGWSGYLHEDGTVEPLRDVSAVADAALLGDRLYLAQPNRQAVSIVDAHTLDEITAIPSVSGESVISPRENGDIFVVSSFSWFILREGSESAPLDRLGIQDEVGRGKSVFSLDGSELIVASQRFGDYSSARISRVYLDENGTTGVDVDVSEIESVANFSAPMRRSPGGGYYYWDRLLIDAASLEISVMDERIVGMDENDQLVVLETKAVNLTSGLEAPLPVRVEWSAPLGGNRLYLLADDLDPYVYEPVYVIRPPADPGRLILDTWFRRRDGLVVLTYRATSPRDETLAIESSVDGLRWQEVPETRFESSLSYRREWHLEGPFAGKTRLFRVRRFEE